MSEVITPPDQEGAVEVEENPAYSSIPEFLSAFEQSAPFEEALEERHQQLTKERPDLELSRKDLIYGLRLTQSYTRALIDFYRAGQTIPKDITAYSQEAQEALEDYFDHLKSVGRHSDLLRFHSEDKEKYELNLFLSDKTRDRYHTIAGLAIMGEGITLENGDRIVCDKLFPEEESALPLDSYTVLGRNLVTIIAEENHLDIVDPDRERKKVEATLKFLNSLRYSGGHWVGKGEK